MLGYVFHLKSSYRWGSTWFSNQKGTFPNKKLLHSVTCSMDPWTFIVNLDAVRYLTYLPPDRPGVPASHSRSTCPLLVSGVLEWLQWLCLYLKNQRNTEWLWLEDILMITLFQVHFLLDKVVKQPLNQDSQAREYNPSVSYPSITECVNIANKPQPLPFTSLGLNSGERLWQILYYSFYFLYCPQTAISTIVLSLWIYYPRFLKAILDND